MAMATITLTMVLAEINDEAMMLSPHATSDAGTPPPSFFAPGVHAT